MASWAGVGGFAYAVMMLLGEECGEADVRVLAGDVGDLEDAAADYAACCWEGWGEQDEVGGECLLGGEEFCGDVASACGVYFFEDEGGGGECVCGLGDGAGGGGGGEVAAGGVADPDGFGGFGVGDEVSQTRAVWPWRRKAAALSQAPVRSSARTRIWGRDGAEEGDCAGISVTDWELICLVSRALSAATLFSSVYLNFRSADYLVAGFSGWVWGTPSPVCFAQNLQNRIDRSGPRVGLGVWVLDGGLIVGRLGRGFLSSF